MWRAAATGVVLALLATAPAPAAPRALVPIANDSSIALAGNTALFTRGDRGVRVYGVPVDGTAAPAVALRYTPPDRASFTDAPALSASAERTVLLLQLRHDDTESLSSELFSGLPFAPLAPAGTPGFFLGGIDVDGPRLATVEVNPELPALRFAVHEPGAEPRVIALPDDLATDVIFAGDLVAFARLADGEDQARRFVVRDWRTGADRTSVRVAPGVEAFDLRADGRAVVEEVGGGLVEVAPGGAVRRLTRHGESPIYAGDRILFRRDGRLMMIEPDGSVRPFGVPTARLQDVAVDDQHVLWRANGCLLSAPVTEPAASAPAPGSCPRSEVEVDDESPPTLRRDRHVPLHLRCLAAASPGCVGTLRVKGAAAVRFRIPAGTRRRLVVRLTPRAYAAALKNASGIDGTVLDLRAVTTDPAGRDSVLDSAYSVIVR